VKGDEKKRESFHSYQAVQGGVSLVLEGTALAFSIFDGGVDEMCITGFIGCGQDQGWVGGRILPGSRYVTRGK
jgi:hypothetical protein